MFSRNNLQFHPELAAEYYTAHPGKKEIDRKIQAKPEIGEPGTAYYDYYGSPIMDAAIETAHQYVEAAKIADIIAQYIRLFGYDARAHTDADYQVLCVPLAVDSRRGVLGRLGILIHPVYGPCLRLAVVTTDIELLPANKYRTYPIEFFCKICKKCAANCPSNKIKGKEVNLNQVVEEFKTCEIIRGISITKVLPFPGSLMTLIFP